MEGSIVCKARPGLLLGFLLLANMRSSCTETLCEREIPTCTARESEPTPAARLCWYISVKAEAPLIEGAIQDQSEKPITNEDIINMVKAGLDEKAIITTVEESATAFDTSVDGLLTLRESGASQALIQAILNAANMHTSATRSVPAIVRKPNFSGQWVVDKAKSFFKPARNSRGFDGLLLQVDHQEPNLRLTWKLRSKSDEEILTLSLTTDGQENSNVSAKGLKVTSRTRWDGMKLVTEGIATGRSAKGKETTVHFKSLYSLDDDQRVLLLDEYQRAGKGQAWIKLVMAKE